MSETPIVINRRAPKLGEHNDEIYGGMLGRSSRTIDQAARDRRDLTREENMSRYAFEGIHVLDFAWVGVGPITTKYLADNGAEVIRIESVSRLDVLRIAPPWKDGQPGPNNSQFFASYNTSKKGITLDLEETQGAGADSETGPLGGYCV